MLGHSEIDVCSIEPLPDDQLIPDTFNWADLGFVSPVYHQFSCGSCYVFSTTSALESQFMIRANMSGQPIRLSVQETLNCMQNGCGGGTLFEPMNRFVNEGVTLDRYDPYINEVSCMLKQRNQRMCLF